MEIFLSIFTETDGLDSTLNRRFYEKSLVNPDERAFHVKKHNVGGYWTTLMILEMG